MVYRPKHFDELLLLDDDEDDYILMKSLLHGAFGEAVKLDWYQKNGVAIEMICSGIYAVNMVDYRLGIENGLDVIRDAKIHCPEQVVFLVTSWNHKDQLEQAKQAGAEGYLEKTELSSELLKKIFTPYLQLESRKGTGS
jgi:hypothetical protein